MLVRSPWCSGARPAPPRQPLTRPHELCIPARPSAATRAPGGGRRRGTAPPAGSRRRQQVCPAAAASRAASDKSKEVLLLDLVLPAPPEAVALALFGSTCSGSSDSSSRTAPPAAAPHGLLVQHMQQVLGCTGMEAGPWQAADGRGSLRRGLHYATPLSRRQRLLLPLGPAAVPNTEEQRLSADGDGGVQLSSSVASDGIPFAGSFTNRLEWRLLPHAAAEGGSRPSTPLQAAALAPSSAGSRGHTRLLLTARCAFHKRVLGPLRGQIEEQSLQASWGMRDAYCRLAPLFQQHFSSNGSGGGITNASKASCLSSSNDGSGSGSSSGSGSEAAWAAAQAAVRQHMPGPSAAECLRQAETLWPAWSAAACRLQPGRQAAGAEPTPEEAAAALQVVARRALALPPAQRQQELAKSRCVRGLVEALRLLPPRHAAPSSSPPSSSGGRGPQSAGAVAAALWALAVLGGSIWWEPEAEALCAPLPANPPASLRQASDAAWALATMRHFTPHLPLLEEAGAAALQRQLERLAAGEAASAPAEAGSNRQQAPAPPSLSQLASLLWGMATLGHRPARLLPLLPPVLQCQGAPPSFTALCTIAWSLAVAGCLQHPAADAVAAALAGAAEGLAPASAKKAALLQLHQFSLALQLAAEQAAEPGAVVSGQPPSSGAARTALLRLRQHAGMQPLLAAAAAAWEAEGRHRGSKQVSAAQADVAATARGLGLAVQEEHAVAGLSVDIAVPSRRLAVEVDGPTHFARNAPPGGGEHSSEGGAASQPLGATLLKHRLLRQQGWAVVGVDAAQWERLRGAAQKRAHLAAAIAAAQGEGADSISGEH